MLGSNSESPEEDSVGRSAAMEVIVPRVQKAVLRPCDSRFTRSDFRITGVLIKELKLLLLLTSCKEVSGVPGRLSNRV